MSDAVRADGPLAELTTKVRAIAAATAAIPAMLALEIYAAAVFTFDVQQHEDEQVEIQRRKLVWWAAMATATDPSAANIERLARAAQTMVAPTG